MMGSSARRGSRGGLILAGAFLILPLGSASAATPVFHSPPQFTIGPLAMSHGFKVTIFGGCNQKPDFANVIVTKKGHHYNLSYDYVPRSGAKTTCKVTRKLGSGSLSMRWGAALRATLKLAATGPRKPLRLKGCTGTFGHTRKVEGTGTLKLAIHTKVFGKLILHGVPAQIQVNGGRGHCPPGGYSANFVNLTSNFPPHSNRQLDAYMAPNGHRSLYVSVENYVGKLWQDVSDTFTGSRRLFSFASDLSSAHIGSPGSLLSGSLGFSATSSCSTGSTSPPEFRFGNLRGKLVVHDPVLGRLSFAGAKAQQVAISRGPYSCAVS